MGNFAKQKYYIFEDFCKLLNQKNINYHFADFNQEDFFSDEAQPYAKEYYNKAVLRNDRISFIRMCIVLAKTKEDYEWIKEQIRDVPNKFIYFHENYSNDIFPIDNVIYSNEKNEEFLKDGFVLASETTIRKKSEIVEGIQTSIGDCFFHLYEEKNLKDFFWQLLNERLEGVFNVIWKLTLEKDPNILNFCRGVLKNSVSESVGYKKMCYMLLRDKHLKQDTEFLMDFIQREKNNFPTGWQKGMEETLVKLQKKLENNKAK